MSNSNNLPENLRYTASHEWVRQETDGTITVGITQHAQELLGDMVFVETPAIGRQLKAKEECAVAESVKAAADIYAPVNGVVVAVNSELGDAPEKINEDPYSAWMFQIKPDNASDVDGLMDAVAYQAMIDSESH